MGSTDNEPITLYDWRTDIATLTLTSANTATATFTAPEVDATGFEIILTLTVTDTVGVADSATVLMTVTPQLAITLDIDGNSAFDRMNGIMIVRCIFSSRGDGLTRSN